MRLLGFQVPFTGGSTVALRKAAVEPISSIPSIGSSSGRGGWFGLIREGFAGAWQRNIVLDPRDSVLAFSAVYACITRIANDIAKMPVRLVEMDGNGIWTPVLRNSPYIAVLTKPNRFQNRIQFYTCWLLSKLSTGNTYILKQRDQRGIVVAMYVLDPHRVQPLIADDGGVYYRLGKDMLSNVEDAVTVPASEIIHDLMNPLFHPLVGVSPLYACGHAATQGNRIQANSAKFFGNMSQPGGILTAPAGISDETAKRLKEYWEQNYTGTNAGRIAVLGDGLKYEQMSITAVDAQLIEQLKWTAEDVARAFAVPLYKINAGPVPTSNNVEALDQQYYSGCLQIHIEAMELCLDEGLGVVDVADFTYGTEFDLDVLLRMDSATALDSLAKAVGAAIMSPNEARARRNLKPVAGGESPMIQQQNYSLQALAKRDSKADPFAGAASPAPSPAPAPAAAAPAAPAEPDAQKQFELLMWQITKEFDEAMHA